MTPRKEAIVKSNCFKSATQIYASTLERGEGLDFNDHSASVVYSIAIKLFKNGRDRYWKENNPYFSYEPQFLKRIYLWIKERLWEKKLEK